MATAASSAAASMMAPVTREEQRFYEENGFLLAKGILPRDECAARRQELHDLAARLRTKKDINATWRGSHLSEEERKAVAGNETQRRDLAPLRGAVRIVGQIKSAERDRQ